MTNLKLKKGTRNKSILLNILLLLFFTVTIQQCSSPEEEIILPVEEGRTKPDNETWRDDPGDTDPVIRNPLKTSMWTNRWNDLQGGVQTGDPGRCISCLSHHGNHRTG